MQWLAVPAVIGWSCPSGTRTATYGGRALFVFDRAWLADDDGRLDGTPVGRRSSIVADAWRQAEDLTQLARLLADRRHGGMGVGWPEDDRSGPPPAISLQLTA